LAMAGQSTLWGPRSLRGPQGYVAENPVMPATQHTVRLPERYLATRRIAAGGMATVYACQDQVLGRLVAVKVLAPHVAADSDAAARFQREARAAARVSDHPHVVTIYDIGEHEGTAFIVMEYLPGGTLNDRLRSGEPIPRATAVRWLDEAASALDHAHRAGIVHRDVKPANLLLDANGRLAVGDFGIARMVADSGVTATGVVLGTAAYLSPEQALGRPATAASDRYALAVVAYELLTGRRPFVAEHPAAQARAHVETPPPRPSALASDLSKSVDRVIWRGMEKQPDHRWATASDMVDALDDALGDTAEPVTAPTAPVAARATAPPLGSRSSSVRPVATAPRHRWAPVLVAAAVVGLLAGAAIAALIGAGNGAAPGSAADHQRFRTAETTAAARSVPPAQSAPSQAPSTATPPPAAQSASQLVAQGHALVREGRYAEAIDLLRKATDGCPVATTDPCAYALYDLGHALRLAGRPQEAIPVLSQRLQNPDQRRAVQAELERAQHDAGAGPGKPGKGPNKDKPKKGDEGD